MTTLRRWVWITAGMLGIVTVLAACGNGGGVSNDPNFQSQGNGVYATTVVTVGGKTVDCVVYNSNGITCDWDHAR